LIAQNTLLIEANRLLVEEIKGLKNKIAFLENGKKSSTSHTPPSHDFTSIKRVNLREKTDKKSGGQMGHTGFTLELKEKADIEIQHRPTHCKCCGKCLADMPFSVVSKRQVIDIAPLAAKYSEHQSLQITCTCKQVNVKELPTHLTAPIQYGSGVTALVGYLSTYQYVPFNRIQSLFKELFLLPISEGTLVHMLDKLHHNALPFHEQIRKRILKSNVVGADETGVSIAGKKAWMHVWQNTHYTYIVASLNRGFATIAKHFEHGFSKLIYVSDCWAAQLKTNSKKKQICLAHLMREAKNFEQSLGCTWSKKLKQLLKASIETKNQLTPQEYKNNTQIEAHKIALSSLLQQDSSNFDAKVKTFQKRLCKYEQHIFTFLDHPEVPPDNNASERAIRNVKVKTKISTGFRTLAGAEIFATLRSVVDTTIKNNNQVFKTFELLAITAPE
jgi:transposase